MAPTSGAKPSPSSRMRTVTVSPAWIVTPIEPLPRPVAAIASAAFENMLPMTWDRITRFASTCTGCAGKLKAIEALQGERYVALAERRPANEAFLYGWLANRA